MNLECVNCFYRHGGMVVTSTGENILNLVLMKLIVSSSQFCQFLPSGILSLC